MKSTQLTKIEKAFNVYRDTVFKVDTDIKFWHSFLQSSIIEFQNNPSSQEIVFEAIFHVYNIDQNTGSGLLKTMNKIEEKKTIDLGSQCNDFFAWLMLLSILRTYNAVEILLLQSIQITYYPSKKDPTISKNAWDIVNREIKSEINKNAIRRNYSGTLFLTNDEECCRVVDILL